MECSPITRLLFIGLWNFCDDAGRHQLSGRRIKAEVFPGDDFTSENVLGMLQELNEMGLIDVYTVEDKEYLQVTGWHHQRIDKPQEARFPSKPEGDSGSVPRMFGALRDSIGEEWKGEEKKDAAPGARIGNGEEKEKTQEVDLFIRGKFVLGDNAGGMIAKVLKVNGGNIALARAVIEKASTKQNPREYIGAIIRDNKPEKPESPDKLPNFMPGIVG